MHSTFFNKSFGDSNIRPFFWFNVISLAVCCIYFYLIGRQYWTDSASEFFVGKIMLIHSMMSNKVFTAFLILEFYTLYLLQFCLAMITAIFCGMTLNEYMNVQNYPYLYTVEKVRLLEDNKDSKKRIVYYHKRVNMCLAIYNLVVFFCCGNKKR